MPRQRVATRPKTIPPRHASLRRLSRGRRPQRRLPTKRRLEVGSTERRRRGTGADPADESFMVRRPLERCCERTRKKAAPAGAFTTGRGGRLAEPARFPDRAPGEMEHGRRRRGDIGALRKARQPRDGNVDGPVRLRLQQGRRCCAGRCVGAGVRGPFLIDAGLSLAATGREKQHPAEERDAVARRRCRRRIYARVPGRWLDLGLRHNIAAEPDVDLGRLVGDSSRFVERLRQ